MSIKYEIHSIKNAQGAGEERYFARIFEREPMNANQLKSHSMLQTRLQRAASRPC